MNAEVMPSVFPATEVSDSSGERLIGDIIQEMNKLTAAQLQSVIDYQREHAVKFGEAAVALGLATQEDVLWALSQQFQYPYAKQSARSLTDELVIVNQPFCAQSEIIRGIRSHMVSSLTEDGHRPPALAIVSTEAGDGKTFFAANMAAALSQLGEKTLIIDADMRAPRLHEVFKVDNHNGLSSVLSGRVSGNVLRKVDGLPNLVVLPVGVTPPNPIELLQRPAFALLLRQLRSEFTYIIVDTPSASHGIDARVISTVCGATLAIARKDRTRTEALQTLLGSALNSNNRLLGVVVNEH